MLSSIPLFTLPDQALAKEPPEKRGIGRDSVRLMVIERDTHRIHHSRFSQFAEFLQPGDLLVFNNSRTIPACLRGRSSDYGVPVEIRLAEQLPDNTWYALLISRSDMKSQETIQIDDRIQATVISPHRTIPRLWKIRFDVASGELLNALYQNGEPVRYEYVARPWELDYYQTIYGFHPGSAEMPSAGRAFTWRLLFSLKRKGIELASITLHAGLSSYMDHVLDSQHPISEEEFSIEEKAAVKINEAKSRGRRIIAVGTTVVRALESAAEATHGSIQPLHGYTSLRITADYKLQIVKGLLTGFHEPEASHLDLLTAFLTAAEIQSAYQNAIASGYLWHEFGDLNLIL
jgi:S-adenosylmethionine:tRNA ribosyltransferase-isomerase